MRGSTAGTSAKVTVSKPSPAGVARWRTTTTDIPNRRSTVPICWPIGPQPTMVAVWPCRSRGMSAPISGAQRRSRWVASICGRCRASASSPASAVCATTLALAPDEVVTVTPCWRSWPNTGRSAPAECVWVQRSEGASSIAV
ncbi:hypothetical protein D3C87_1357690 [compost metagenome]